MEKRPTKPKDEYKKIERPSKDRGDLKKSFLTKSFEEFSTNKDSIPVRDRGDSVKTNGSKQTQANNDASSNKAPKPRVNKKKPNEITPNQNPLPEKAKNVPHDGSESSTDSRKQPIVKITPKAVNNVKVTPKVVEVKKSEDPKTKTVRPTGKDAKDCGDKINDQDDSKNDPKSKDIEAININYHTLLLDGSKQLLKQITLNILDKKKQGAKKKNLPRKDVKRDKFDVQNRPYLDVERRKLLRDRYTVKLKNNVQDTEKGILKTDERENKKHTDDETRTSEPTKDSQMDATRPAKKPKPELTLVQRKPIIKTIRVSNDSRVYKAVTFIDQKEAMPLQIKMPNFKKKSQDAIKLKSKVVSKQSVLMKTPKKRKEKSRFKNRIQSPMTVNSVSPSTEVAKWAPSCMSKHTKPYYEAWVDTTLAAYNKCSDKEKVYVGKQNVVQTFKRALEMDERPGTPDLVYVKLNDEQYTGRITVRQSVAKENRRSKKLKNFEL